jgi:tetrapyrrole methylase family protein / MazG family protein
MQKLLDIMKTLRSENGCNWDKKQTHESLIPYVIEEAYEVVEAIEKKDKDNLKEELGDLLFQVVFHSQIAEEASIFNFQDVVDSISDKLVRRHPHVFSEKENLSPDEVLTNWAKIKEKEKEHLKKEMSLLGKIPPMPALEVAFRVQKKAAEVGFDWDSVEGVKAKVLEELGELEEEWKGESSEAIEEELGDLLFSVINLSRFLKIDPEKALRRTNNKFLSRFSIMEKITLERNLNFHDLKMEEKEDLWKEAKKKDRA